MAFYLTFSQTNFQKIYPKSGNVLCKNQLVYFPIFTLAWFKSISLSNSSKWFNFFSHSYHRLPDLIFSILFLKYKGACQKTNGRMSSNLSTRDDIEIRPGYDSHCLIESFEEANKLRCLAACNLDCLCYMLTHDGAKCSLYDHSAINYFMKRSNNAKKVYVKK